MLIVVFVVFWAVPVVAQDAETQTPSVDTDTTSANRIDETTLIFADDDTVADDTAGDIASFGAADFIRMMLVLGFVICVIYALFYVLRRASNRNLPHSSALQVLGTTQLAAGRSIHLVEVGGQVLLVGSSEHSVNLITEVTNSETIDELLLEAASRRSSSGAGATRRFGDLLGDMLSRGRSAGASVREPATTSRTEPASPPREPEPVGASSGFYAEQRERLRQL